MIITANEAKAKSVIGDIKESEMYTKFYSYIHYIIDINCGLGVTSCIVTNLDVLDRFTLMYFKELAGLAKSDLESLGYTVSDVINDTKFNISWSD